MKKARNIVIIDYGMGNLRSAQKAFEYLGYNARVSRQSSDIKLATHVVLPGVGAFAGAIERISLFPLKQAVLDAIAAKKPFLGICLGMQLLFDTSEEGGMHGGLSAFEGDIKLLDTRLKKPHVGWNIVKSVKPDCPLFKGLNDTYFYFVHSYCLRSEAPHCAAGITDYGGIFTSAVWDGGALFATQFHPEKSGASGLRMLDNFASI
ncbi:MAG: imidazole glycerol phosphate synthase subunit HisH [Christensenellales bacterium]|jgi:glutamine amidotransferase